MAKVKKPKTNPPKGIVVARNVGKFAVTWKIGDKDYKDGQQFQWKINKGKWRSVTIGTGTTSKSLSVDLSDYYPTTKTKLNSISVRIRGRRKDYKKTKKGKTYTYKPKWSNWETYKYSVQKPNKPKTLIATLDSNLSNVCAFAWETTTDDTSKKIFRNTRYESIRVKDSNVSNGAKLSWKSSNGGWMAGTESANDSVTITEDSALLATASYTRWVRVKARGSAGDSGWKYVKHVYASPFQSKISSASVKQSASGGYICSVKWQSATSTSKPIDHTTVQYCFVTPDAGLQCPEGASWTDAVTIRDTKGDDGCSFSVDSVVGYDQCMFVRVNNHHDSNVVYGVPYMTAVGALTAPSGVSVSSDSTTHRATITATNNSSVLDSFLVITYKTAKDPNGFPIGIIPHGSTSVTVQCPAYNGAVAFGVYACVGAYEATTRGDGVGSYAIDADMTSTTVTQGGTVPVAPASVTLETTSITGTIRVIFDWTWNEAVSAEISWADHEDAWESTDEPSTYKVNSTHASAWNISGLETGVTWYVRVRLISGTGDNETYGAYSPIKSIDLSSSPAIPVLTLSEGVITEGETVTASWGYVSTDGTPQAYAEVAEVTTEGSETVYTPIAQTETAQYVTISSDGWNTGETHDLVVRVVSASGKESQGWSDPVSVTVAEPLTATITQHSLVSQTITIDGDSRTVNSLTVMPLTLTVTGAGAGGTTTVVIERAETYNMARPDESEKVGFEGETICILSQTGEAQITIDQDDLLGFLDDEAPYRIIATVQDGLGQSDEATLDFEVHWAHQAILPEAQVVTDLEEMISILTPIAPTGWTTGDVCDIYRLSVDKPQLIYPNAVFGTKYVDPYPTIGEFGGHRFVYKTVNGDYITEDNEIAWLDTDENEGDYLETEYNVIDFGTDRVRLQYNVDLSNTWKKDFKETQYLGGSVQGDWNPAVTRTASFSSVVIAATDPDTIEGMRRLAVYPGICHVRTKDGSSYAADVEVSESYKQSTSHKVVEFSLSITRVDPETYDGMTYAEWMEG